MAANAVTSEAVVVLPYKDGGTEGNTNIIE